MTTKYGLTNIVAITRGEVSGASHSKSALTSMTSGPHYSVTNFAETENRCGVSVTSTSVRPIGGRTGSTPSLTCIRRFEVGKTAI